MRALPGPLRPLCRRVVQWRSGAPPASRACFAVALLQAAVTSATEEAGVVGGHAASKARVERGEGVPFFDERFGCRDDGRAWSSYRELVQHSRLRIFDPVEGPELAGALAHSLHERTSNLTEVLQCNVGIIAGYHLLARYYVAAGDDSKAYGLLQLALIWVFTLRNANRVPTEAALEWFTRSDHLVHEIKALRRRVARERARRTALLPDAAPDFRQPGLRIGVVSICAYPPDHPLELRALTPANRRLYAQRHGYGVHLHMLHPMPDQGVHVQHAKLALMTEYLRSGEYDWVAWFDCDSLLMNPEKTLDSIIYRYAGGALEGDQLPHSTTRRDGRFPWRAQMVEKEAENEPKVDEVLTLIVAHPGSCNTPEGCRANAMARVNRRVRYTVTAATALVDMEEHSEKLASLSVGGYELGECNPSPGSDFDCGFFDCYREVPVPQNAVAGGVVLLEAHAVGTHDDCACSFEHEACYPAQLAAVHAMTGGNATDASFGMFVRFTLTPVGLVEAEACGSHAVEEELSGTSPAPLQQPSSGSPQSAGNRTISEPSRDQTVVGYLAHEGSCNTNEGCHAMSHVRLHPDVSYRLRVSAALVDMEDESEKVSSISVGGRALGECNPSPESDFDCGFFDCVTAELLPAGVVGPKGLLVIEAHSVRTHDDCFCSLQDGMCYNRAHAVLLEVHGLGKVDATYGMFVKFTFVPLRQGSAAEASSLDVNTHEGAAEALGAGEEAHGLDPEQDGSEPFAKDTIVAWVVHAGSCNTVHGCRAATQVRVNPKVRYEATVSTALIDMEDDSEKLSSVSIGGRVLGECNPAPVSDYDCSFFDCFHGEQVPSEAISSGTLLLEAHSVRTSDDCLCSGSTCYAAPLAEMFRAMGENASERSYGMYVRFVLTPVTHADLPSHPRTERSAVGLACADRLEEPLADEVVEAYVGHVGSCNTDEGCREATGVRLNREVRYRVSVATAMVDMAEPSEKLSSVSVGGLELGDCNPSPADDFDCGYWDCFKELELPLEATSTGLVELEAHSVKTSSDCHCNRLHGHCYSALSAAMDEAAGEELTTDPRYGMFVKFTFVPIAPDPQPECLCSAAHAPRAWATLRRQGAECVGADALLGVELPLEKCLESCLQVEGCRFVAAGTGQKAGLCFWNLGSCTEFEDDSYDVYQVDSRCAVICAADGAARLPPVTASAGAEGPVAPSAGVDLLITEEGWGLSSANWLIRRSAWSLRFLERAFRLCHEEMPLFGDQDAMIHLLLNDGALGAAAGDVLDTRATVVPQREINAYDALNAFYMEADAYEEGDLLVTFPGCKEPTACNPLFRLAAAYAEERAVGRAPELRGEQSWAHTRLFGPPQAAARLYELGLRTRRES